MDSERNYCIRLKKGFFVTGMKNRGLFVGKVKYDLIFATLLKISLSLGILCYYYEVIRIQV
jgi:hypothetical protein